MTERGLGLQDKHSQFVRTLSAAAAAGPVLTTPYHFNSRPSEPRTLSKILIDSIHVAHVQPATTATNALLSHRLAATSTTDDSTTTILNSTRPTDQQQQQQHMNHAALRLRVKPKRKPSALSSSASYASLRQRLTPLDMQQQQHHHYRSTIGSATTLASAAPSAQQKRSAIAAAVAAADKVTDQQQQQQQQQDSSSVPLALTATAATATVQPPPPPPSSSKSNHLVSFSPLSRVHRYNHQLMQQQQQQQQIQHLAAASHGSLSLPTNVFRPSVPRKLTTKAGGHHHNHNHNHNPKHQHEQLAAGASSSSSVANLAVAKANSFLITSEECMLIERLASLAAIDKPAAEQEQAAAVSSPGRRDDQTAAVIQKSQAIYKSTRDLYKEIAEQQQQLATRAMRHMSHGQSAQALNNTLEEAAASQIGEADDEFDSLNESLMSLNEKEFLRFLDNYRRQKSAASSTNTLSTLKRELVAAKDSHNTNKPKTATKTTTSGSNKNTTVANISGSSGGGSKQPFSPSTCKIFEPSIFSPASSTSSLMTSLATLQPLSAAPPPPPLIASGSLSARLAAAANPTQHVANTLLRQLAFMEQQQRQQELRQKKLSAHQLQLMQHQQAQASVRNARRQELVKHLLDATQQAANHAAVTATRPPEYYLNYLCKRLINSDKMPTTTNEATGDQAEQVDDETADEQTAQQQQQQQQQTVPPPPPTASTMKKGATAHTSTINLNFTNVVRV